MILTVAGAVASASRAEAALYYWNDYDPGYYRPAQPLHPRRPKVRRNTITKKSQAAEKETGAKPQGPLVISISIDQQKVRIYDSNGLFAEGPVSTGMKGHPTPMGVFSIIQKHKMHHSNIYSGAPMPFMQRITWSGVAMHAGVLPGYPASHGCIRMPMTFATRMWNWTKMGARVLVTPGEVTPAPFSHPLLVTQKVVPIADEAPQVDAPLGVKSDKGADATHEVGKSTDTADAKLELRSTVGHARTHTADARGAIPANAAVTMFDASPAAASGEVVLVKAAEAAASDDKPAEAKPVEILTGEIKPAPAGDKSDAKAEVKAEASVSAQAEDKAVEPKADAKAEAGIEAPQAVPAKADEPKTIEKTIEKAAEPAAEPAKAVSDKAASEKPATEKAVTEAPAKKDTSRLPGLEKAKPELKREGQVAVFISRKDGKLYVRQNFKPVFDVPVTIAPSDKLLGTHVFTAEIDKNDPNILRWSVVSLPVTARNAQKSDYDERATRRRKVAGSVPAETKQAPAPNTPAEALDRIIIAPDVMTKIVEALTTGTSIMVSDQGINQGETGEGTDFIVRLR